MKYDSFTNLVKKIEDNKTTYYINKEYEYTYDTDIKTLNVIQEFKHNLFSGNSIVAVHTRTKVNDEKQVDKTAYIHKDSLGSVDTVTNSRAQIVLRNTYTPFGALLSSLNPNTKFKKEDLRGYTSHKQLYSFNLIDMGGRMYDPRISRFLSVDPLLSRPYNSQRYNRYNYVMNNPLKYIDPTGYDILSADDKKKGYTSSSGEKEARDYHRKNGHKRDRDGKVTVTKPIVEVTPPPKYKNTFVQDTSFISSVVDAISDFFGNSTTGKVSKIISAPASAAIDVTGVFTANNKTREALATGMGLVTAAAGVFIGSKFRAFSSSASVVGGFYGNKWGKKAGYNIYDSYDGIDQFSNDSIDSW
ncbi:MAG: hypothetical protein MJK08_02080 [Campylobacterales bacterium]|nr:hypothetical protein [Campylobacterales bacterium]